jgi:uncharacterized protein YndB with AHSA1/START domain
MPHSLKVTTPSDLEITLTRTFDAPAELVYEAFTTPELVKRWMGPRAYPVIEADIDLRVGGAYHYIARVPDGTMGFGGRFKEIVPNRKLVATEVFDQHPDTEILVTTTFVEENGKTTVTLTSTCPTTEVRDAILKSGMESGVAEGYDRLDELLRG